jgi:hypothetical protein
MTAEPILRPDPDPSRAGAEAGFTDACTIVAQEYAPDSRWMRSGSFTRT